ncbi:MAG TPA: FUSC family protein [Elusimicrobiota bacterium]|nr:FUSC family protein [Elusimicrobiota bacterium]
MNSGAREAAPHPVRHRKTPRETGVVLQALLTAAAATGSYYLSSLLGIPQSYWAAIAAINVMQSEIGATAKTSLSRLAGTAIGALVGGLFAVFFGGHLLSFSLAVVAAVLLCALLDRWESYRFAGVTVAIVMLVPYDASPWIMAGRRFVQISLGIVFALGVEYLGRLYRPARQAP